MAKRRDAAEPIEVPSVDSGCRTLTLEEKVEFLQKVIAKMFIHLGETDLLERVTKGDSEFKPKKKGGD